MLDHHIQRQIVYDLAFSNGLRFSELKPDSLENKAFDYHLKKVIVAGYVVKNGDGTYSLTSEGKRVGKGALKKQSRLIDRAYSVLLLAIQREDGAWLLSKRKSQPLLGLTGFMNVQPRSDQQVVETAADVCRQQTGLAGTFEMHAHGYFRIYRTGELESFIHFTLLRCTDIQGELHQNSELAEYYWDKDPDWQGPDMLPNMRTLHKMLQARAGVFADETFDI
jgi:hypothetical protein